MAITRSKALALVFAFSLSAQIAFAQNGYEDDDTQESLAMRQEYSESFDHKKGISLGFRTGYVKYEEPGLMSESGTLSGVGGSYDYLLSSSLLRFEAELLAGKLTYNGAVQDMEGNTWPSTSSSRDTLTHLRASLVEPYHLDITTMLFFQGGLGYRKLTDRIEGEGGYSRSITYIYLPVGVSLKKELGTGWSMTGNLEYDLLLDGTVNSYLSEASRVYPDITNKQKLGSGSGYRVAGTLRKNFHDYAVTVQPYWQTWQVADSEKVTVRVGNQYGTFVEPKNTSSLVGLNVGVDL